MLSVKSIFYYNGASDLGIQQFCRKNYPCGAPRLTAAHHKCKHNKFSLLRVPCILQVWQWLHHSATLDGGQPLTLDRFLRIMDEEMAALKMEVGPAAFNSGNFQEAAALFSRFSTSQRLEDFLTIPAYDAVVAKEMPKSRL